MKLKDGFVLRQIAGENVVVPSGSEMNLNMMITLNDTGAFLWERLDKGAQKSELVAALLAEYDVDEATAKDAVDSFVADLEKNEFLAD